MLGATLRITAGLALSAIFVWAQTTPQPAAQQKKVKDQGEYEIYNEAIKDASNPAKEIQDLDA